MNINFFSVTFWFDIFTNHAIALEKFQESLTEYNNFNKFDYSDNYFAPIITAANDEKKTNLVFSQINLQYNMDLASLGDMTVFKEKVLSLYEILESLGISVLHTAIFVNADIVDKNALQKIAKNTISSSFLDDNLVDVMLKIGKKHEDLFYKIATLLNKKQIKLPKLVDEKNRVIPIPLISWNDAVIENEVIELSYEINDKYSFDVTKNYHTTEFYLNKMLYIFQEDFESDIKDLLDNGNF